MFRQLTKFSLKILLLAFIFSAIQAQAATALDASFVPVVESKPSSSLPMYVHAVQSDGKIIVGGLFGVIGGKVRKNFARLNTDGTTDETFQVGTGTDESVNAIAIQADGKIIIGGFFTTYNGINRSRLARLNADGSLDSDFNAVLNNVVYEIIVQSDGKILVGGEFTNVNGTPVNQLIRLNSDSTLDASFDIGNSEVSNPVRAIAVQTDGKIMVGGQNISSGTPRPFLRLNANGSTDASFNIGSGVNGALNDIVIQSDGKYLIGGSFNGFNGGASPNNIARINADGTLDTSFSSGFSAFDEIKKIALQTDGKLFAIGTFAFFNTTPTRGIVKLNTNGTLDSSFNTNGGVDITNPISSVNVLSDGKVLLSGFFSAYSNSLHNGIVKINQNGTPDETFAPRLGNVGTITDMVVVSGGRIVIVGNFSYINGVAREKIARLLPAGLPDTTFDPGTGINTGINGNVNSIFVQSDEKILIAGDFASYNGTTRDNIARINTDGSLDTTFNSGAMNDFEVVDDIAQTSTGKIVVGGSFGSIGGTARTHLAQLNADGSVDTAFTHPILDGRVRTVLPESDGKLYIGGGTFTMSQPQAFFRGIVRLNTNGSIDNTFATGTGANGIVFSLAQQTNGKLIIGGGFLSYNGTNIQSIARINSDGTLDTTFNPGSSAGGQITELAIDIQGRIFAGGNFPTFDGISVGRIVRLRSNGSFDQSFPIGKGSNRTVTSLAIQNFTGILVGGSSEFNGFARGGIARLSNISALVPNFDYDGDGKSDISIFRPASGQWWLNLSSTGVIAATFGTAGDKIVPADFTGDGKTDLAFFRPATGEWFVLRSENNSFYSFPFGANGDIPIVGDFDGDGKYDPAVFRSTTATWFISASTQGTIIQNFGVSGDIPVVGDFDGDSKSDIAIYRPSNGQWWLNRSTAGVIAMTFGTSNDKPIQADFTGDGKTDVAFLRPSTSEWFVLRSEDSSFYAFPFGSSGDMPTVGDFDGDGKADAGVFRPTSATWFIGASTQGTIIQQFGINGDIPTLSAYNF